MFEGVGGHKMLMDAYVGGGVCNVNAYISILKPMIFFLNLKYRKILT